MNMLCLYPLEVYNFELRFSQNIIQNGCISLSFLAACHITLSPFSQTRSQRHILATIVLLEHVQLSLFLFSKFMHFEINAPLN